MRANSAADMVRTVQLLQSPGKIENTGLLAICWLFVDYLLAIRLGTCECGVCKGSGMNNEDMDIPDQDQLLHTNAVRPDLYDKQGQCWFCR